MKKTIKKTQYTTETQYLCDKCEKIMYTNSISHCFACYPYTDYSDGCKCAACKQDLCDTCGKFKIIRIEDKDNYDDNRDIIYKVCSECYEKSEYKNLFLELDETNDLITILEEPLDAAIESKSEIQEKIIKLFKDDKNV